MILFDFNQSISLAEWILIGWIGTMIVEEIREVCLLTNMKYIIMVSGGFFFGGGSEMIVCGCFLALSISK